MLGMDARISRRDFLDGALLASGVCAAAACAPAELLAQSANWTGYTGEGDYRKAAGNSEYVVSAAHAVRDGKYDQLTSAPQETGEVFDSVIVGGGFSGLSAALFLRERAGDRFTSLVLDNSAVFGGVAKRNEFMVNGQRLYAPQASVHFQPPFPHSFLAQVYESFGMDWKAFERYQKWDGPEPPMSLARSPYRVLDMREKTYGFFFGKKFGFTSGRWIKDPFGNGLAGVPFPEKLKRELLAYKQGTGEARLWRYSYPGDSISRAIDSMSLEEYYMQVFGLSREAVRILFTGETTTGLGMGPDALSGFCAYAWTSIPTTDDSFETGLQMFPGGNSGMTRMIVKRLIPDAFENGNGMGAVWKSPINFGALDRGGQATRIRLNATVVRVEHDGDPAKAGSVWVTYVDSVTRRSYRVRAKTVIMAGGGWITKHVVRDLDEERRKAYDSFLYSPYLVANVAVRNWRFLYNLGLSGGQWFEGLGRSVDVRKSAVFGIDAQAIGPDSPTVLTLFIDFSNPGMPANQQGHRGRQQLLATSYPEYERLIREQLTDLFGRSGFDAKRDIAGIVLNRWGHAFINPQPGFFFGKAGENGAARDSLRKAPFGRIAFSHSDLAGAMDHRNAFMESHRAVGQLLDAVYS